MKLSYTQKLYYKLSVKLLVIPLVLLLLGIVLLLWLVMSFIDSPQKLIITSFLFGFLTFPLNTWVQKILAKHLDPIIDEYSEPIAKDRDSAKRGSDGEKAVFLWFHEILPESFILLPNLTLPGEKFDIDAVVVGPKGVFIFEIKNYSYKVFFTTEDYSVISGDRILKQLTVDDPREQVTRNARSIENFLEKKGITGIKIHRAVIFVEPNSVAFLGSPALFLINNKETLRRYIMETPDDPLYTPTFCTKIVEAIKK